MSKANSKGSLLLTVAFYLATTIIGLGIGSYYLKQKRLDIRNATVGYDREGKLTGIYRWNNKRMDVMSNFTDLTYLDVRDKNISDQQLVVLRNMPKLQKLHLVNNNLTDDAIPHLLHLEKLINLNLYGNKGISDAALDQLQGLPKLKQIDLRKTSVTPKGLCRLRDALPDLGIDVDPLDASGVSSLRELDANVESDDRYQIVAIDLARSLVSDEELGVISHLRKLQTLHLGETEISDDGLEHLASITSLEELWLSDSEISGVGLEHLKGLINLRRLSLARTDLLGEDLEHLAGLKNLQTLDLSDTDIGDDDLEFLHGLSSLKELWLSGTDVTSDGAGKLIEQIKELNVRGVDFSAAEIGEPSVEPG